MTVRFKCQSEYQRSYGVPRSRSLSPRRWSPLAGLRSDHMGISREPRLQHRRRLSPDAVAQSFTSHLGLSEPDPAAHTHRKEPPAASRSRSVHRKKLSLDPKRSTLPEPGSTPEPRTPAGPRPAADTGAPAGPRPAADTGAPAGPRPGADPGAPAGPRPGADPGAPAGPRPGADPGAPVKSGPPTEKVAARKSGKRRSSQPDSRPLTAAPDGQQRPANRGKRALQWMSGTRGQTLGGHRSEYHRQFDWKKHAAAASPILTAEQVLYSTSRSVPPFKKKPIPLETEYRQSFQGLLPASGPRLWSHLEHQRVPLFHTQKTHRRNKVESRQTPRPAQDGTHTGDTWSELPPKALPPPPAPRRHRPGTEYESSFGSPLCRIPEEGGATDGDGPQVKDLRATALSYRHRAWGTNFSRDHLSQLQSEHNALWEPTDTTDSTSHPPSAQLTFDLCQEADSCSSSCVEALDLASCSSGSSKRLSPAGPADRHTAWEEEEEEEEEEGDTDDEEGRLPTPRMKMRPVQRTHHDLTTPATGGAIIVGALRSSEESSPHKQQGGADVSENRRPRLKSPGCSPDRGRASKPPRAKRMPTPPMTRPSVTSSPLHGLQGKLRHADFQHNGELGLRLRGLPCLGGGSDLDDRLSAMSWHSAASCSAASAVLERAESRRADFWGKR